MTETKTCPKCNQDKPRDTGFYQRPDGQPQSWCKTCSREYRRGLKEAGTKAVRVDEGMHDLVRDAAAANGMPMVRWLSSVVEVALEQPCARRGCVRRALREGSLCVDCERVLMVKGRQ